MRGAYHSYLINKGTPSTSQAVETAAALHKEACELRLARIMNGTEPSHRNGKTLVVEGKTTVIG